MSQLGHILFALSIFIGSAHSQSYFLVGALPNTQPFSLDHVKTLFTQSLQTDAAGNTVLRLDSYIEAYTELSRVFDFFGTVFSFAREDIISKLTTLNTLRTRNRRRRQHYETFENMFAYEYSHAALLLEKPGVSSNRWIHRALRFISRVVEEVREENSVDLRVRVREHYEAILAPHHAWFVRMAARLALNSFPSRQQFLSAIHVPDTAAGRTKLTQAVAVMDQVYDHVQGLYDQYST